MGKFKLPQLTTAQRSGLTLDAREIVYDTDLDLLYYGDGVTLGGLSLQGATGPIGPTGPLANVVDDTSPQAGGFFDPNSHYIGSDKGSDLASSTPLVIGTDGDYFDVTGTTGFSVMTVDANRLFRLQFDGILTIIHGASINLPGGVNFTTAVGDEITFFSTSANTVRLVSISKADGTSVKNTGFIIGTPQSTTSGTTKIFTGIPAGVKQINFNFDNLSLNGTNSILINIGDSGGIETLGYDSVSIDIAASGILTYFGNTGFALYSDSSSSDFNGNFSLFLLNETLNTWVSSHNFYKGSSDISTGSGRKSLSSTLSQLQISGNGSSFDGGEINISYI